MNDDLRREYLARSRRELASRLERLNEALAAELRVLRRGIDMAHGLWHDGQEADDEKARGLLRQMIENHPHGAQARRLLTQIEDIENRLAAGPGNASD